MENWKNQRNMKDKLDRELSDITAGEETLRKILNSAGKDVFEEKVKMQKDILPEEYKKNKSTKTTFKAAFIAAAFAVVSVGSVLGQEYFQRMYQWVKPDKYQNHLNQAENNAPVYNVDNSTKTKDVRTTGDNIVVEWGEYATNGHIIYVSVTLKSKDGSPILKESENYVPINNRAKISTIYVTMDGETKKYLAEHKYGEDDSTLIDDGFKMRGVGCMSYPVEVADDLSFVTFEIQYSNYDVELYGKEIEFAIENPVIDYIEFEDIGVQMSVADLLKGKKPGEDKIYFSEKYPECYIEDYGFITDEEFYQGKKSFFITVVFDKESKEEMEKLALQNVITGLEAQNRTEVLESGRIRLLYAASADKAYSDITNGGVTPIDTTWEHLEKLILKKNNTVEEKMLVEGIWNVSFVVEAEAKEINECCEIIVPAPENKTEPVVVNHIKIDPIEMVITGTITENHDVMEFGYGEPYNPVCTMKDGTVIVLKLGDAGSNSIAGWIKFTYMFPNVVFVENIEKIEWHGVTIWESE